MKNYTIHYLLPGRRQTRSKQIQRKKRQTQKRLIFVILTKSQKSIQTPRTPRRRTSDRHGTRSKQIHGQTSKSKEKKKPKDPEDRKKTRYTRDPDPKKKPKDPKNRRRIQRRNRKIQRIEEESKEERRNRKIQRRRLNF